ncbi:ATP-dependent RNA helicase DDX24-like [Macrosteles quadrilineatus]|uniref:ATP-dependent RNA helicase DDX24-like n=1 Tax=Macrosteles quadrilineatus TaxID=74068 RepID=UPI0023E2C39E|nr:ATP-dependent RNA helicase DDX24-like [Macrosteles quadrilineatus]
MKKVKNKSFGWKPVELNEAVLTGGVEGLIGIEELTEYKLENNELKLPNSLKKSTSVGSPRSMTEESKTRKRKHKGNSQKQTNLTKGVINKFKVTLQDDNKSTKGSKENTETELSSPKRKKREELTNDDLKENIDILPWLTLGVPTVIAQALTDQGFTQPTEIQRLCIPPAIKGRRDILGAAETGSGKTLAFGIPIINGILENLKNQPVENTYVDSGSSSESDKDDADNEDIGCVKVVNLGKHKKQSSPQRLWALVLTPTRELAVQIKNHLTSALKYTDLKVVVLVGGMSHEKQQRLLKYQPHIVVATPGRLWELVNQGEPHLSDIENIRYLAIDETDRMTEVNHFPELRSLLEKINTDPAKQKLRQNFVFSATLTLVHSLPMHTKLKKKKKQLVVSAGDKLKNLINLLGITDPKVVDVTRKTGMSELLTESSIVCSHEQKDYYLFYFLQRHPGRTLVFCNSISCVRRLASLLSVLGCRPLPLHANMIQKQRLKNLERFRDSADGLLLATDVAARGLDIPNVEHVIHYQVPRTSESYVHRSGRTARANHEGLTLLLIETDEQRQYIRLMRTLNRDKELPSFPVVSNLMDAVKQRVNLARDIDILQLQYKKATSSYNWVQKMAEEMDLVVDQDEQPEKVNDRASSVIKKEIAAKQNKLKTLLKHSLRPKGFSLKYPATNMADNSSSLPQSAIEAVRSTLNEKEKKRKSSPRLFKKKKKKLTTPRTEET